MLKVSDITKKFNDQTVLDRLSFSVKRGERIALTAPSGSGKTTLISILAGIDRDFSGKVTFNHKKKGVVFQEPGLFWYKTLRENILYPLELGRVPLCNEVKENYQRWLWVTGLTPHELYYPHQISRGMKQKGALVRALILNPDLLLMDEPFSAMDKTSVRSIVDHIRSSCPDLTMIVATHALDWSLNFYSRILTAEKTPISTFESKTIGQTY